MNHAQAEKIYQKFYDVTLPHDAIGGTATINLLIKLCQTLKPRNVLELGGGKGTLTYTILKHSDAHVDSYEPLEQFASQMKENLKEFDGRYTILPSYMLLPPKRDYDLILIDGGKNDNESGFPKAIVSYLISLNTVKTVIVEGQRKSQKYWITETLWPFFTYKPTKFTDEAGEKKGVLQIDCTPSRNILKNFLNHLYYRKKIY